MQQAALPHADAKEPAKAPVIRLRRSTETWALVFILPVVIGVSIFVLYPILYGFIISLENYSPTHTTFVGLKNYAFILSSSLFWKALVNTVIFTVGAVPVSLLLSLLIAEVINPLPTLWQNVIKAALYLPGATSGVVSALVWLWLFDPTSGFLNYLLHFFHIPPQSWIYSTKEAMLSVLLTVWLSGNGGTVVLFSAARNQIPHSIYEAAVIDHTPRSRMFWRITVPLMKPTVLYALVIGLIGSFQVFAPVYLLTQGGPDLATTTLAYQIYSFAFNDGVFGIASAEAFILGVIIIAISLISYRSMSSDVEY